MHSCYCGIYRIHTVNHSEALHACVVAIHMHTHVCTGTPGATPYGGCYLHFNMVEANLRLR